MCILVLKFPTKQSKDISHYLEFKVKYVHQLQKTWLFRNQDTVSCIGLPYFNFKGILGSEQDSHD